jgi:hypothetical protein
MTPPSFSLNKLNAPTENYFMIISISLQQTTLHVNVLRQPRGYIPIRVQVLKIIKKKKACALLFGVGF